MSTPLIPNPRPALRRAKDGTVHPAAPHLSSLAVVLRPADTRSKPPKQKDRDDSDDKTVELVVHVPKSLRKKLRKRAEEFGWTTEEAAAHVLRVWADG